MKIIVVSDSHGSTFNLKALFKMHADAHMFIHTGDGAEDFVRLCTQLNMPYLAVRGNCDVYSSLPLEEWLELEGLKIYITHGHLHSVKSSTYRLMKAGAEGGADVVLFGHTHEGLCEYVSEDEFEKPFYLINPGSIAQPISTSPTYALLEIRKGEVLPNLASLY